MHAVSQFPSDVRSTGEGEEGEGVVQICNYQSGVNCFPRDDFCVPTEMGFHLKSSIVGVARH